MLLFPPTTSQSTRFPTCSGSSPARLFNSEVQSHVTRIGMSWSIYSCTETQSRRRPKLMLVMTRVKTRKKVKSRTPLLLRLLRPSSKVTVKAKKERMRKKKVKEKPGLQVVQLNKTTHEQRNDNRVLTENT